MNVAEARDKLKNEVKLKIGLIGIGNAGNQIINKCFDEGYNVFAINSSERDLSDRNVNPKVPCFIVGDEARGAGKNREKAKDLFKFNGKKLFDIPAFDTLVKESDIVFVIASTAGGTGSGVAPDLVRLFTKIYPQKIIIFYGILPKLSDSVLAQNNSITCIHEINELKIPFMLSDLSHYEDIPNDKAYQDIGLHITESINVIKGKYIHETVNDSIDENDMRMIVSEPGYMSIYMLDKVTPEMVEKATMQSLVIEKIKNSPATAIQKDGIIKQLGVIVNCPDEIMELSKVGNYSELTKFTGTPLGIYENYSVVNTSNGQFIVIISGMNLPYSRIMKSMEVIEAQRILIEKVKNVALQSDVERLNFINTHIKKDKLVRTTDKDAESKSSVLDDFFD